MAERGNPTDMYRYANFLLKNAMKNEDYSESFEWFSKVVFFGKLKESCLVISAEADSLRAQNNICINTLNDPCI